MSDTQIQSRPYWSVICSHWKIILLGITIGTLLGGIVYFLLPAKWEAEGSLKIGRIGEQNIEPIEEVIVRFKSPTFISAVALKIGRPETIELLEKRYGGKDLLKVELARNSNLIRFKVYAGTAALAKLEADSIVDEIASRHYKLTEPIFNELRMELANLEQEINANKESVEVFTRRVNNFNTNTNKSIADLSLLLSSKITVDNTLATNNRLATKLKIDLFPINVLPTRLIEPIRVSVEPVFPRPLQTLLIGALLGLIFSMIWIARLPIK
jgi:uncharacterized protein involved in exopolysaccharide biosynthesis